MASNSLRAPRSWRPRNSEPNGDEHPDAELDKRKKWLDVLADLLLSSSTPTGFWALVDVPAHCGRERDRFESFSGGWQQCTKYHTPRRRCTWSSTSRSGTQSHVREAHSHGFCVQRLQSWSGLRHSVLICQEGLLATSLGNRTLKQAPRFPIVLLVAFEELLSDENQPCYFRIIAWWLLLQSRGTLRFADHREIEPKLVKFVGGTWTATLSRSKTLGADKEVRSRLLVVDSEAYFRNRAWLEQGWSLLSTKAPFERDCLLPAPSNNFRGVQCREPRYDRAFAVQTRLKWLLNYRGRSSSTSRSSTAGLLTMRATSFRALPQSHVTPNKTGTCSEDGRRKVVSDTVGQRSSASHRYTGSSLYSTKMWQILWRSRRPLHDLSEYFISIESRRSSAVGPSVFLPTDGTRTRTVIHLQSSHHLDSSSRRNSRKKKTGSR